MDAAVVGGAVFAASLVMFGTLRAKVARLERTVETLQARLSEAEAAVPPAPASTPIDIEPFVD